MLARDQEVARLLLDREARGLRAPAMARMAFAAFGALSVLFASVSSQLVLLICLFCAVSLAINTYFLHLLRHRRHVELVGWLGVLFDIFNVAVYPFITKAIYATHGVHWIYGAKSMWIVVCLVLIAISALALRPIYPTLVGGASIVAHLVAFLVARGDPGVLWSRDFHLQVTGPTATPMITNMIFLAIGTATIYFITRAARKTVEEAVERQAERARLVREHSASIMDGRLDALRNLVASLSHEMNTPLGAIKSASATIGRAVRRLSGEVEDPSEKIEHLVRRIEEAAKIPEEASTRLDEMLRRLTVFSNLDASESSSVDVNKALDRTISLLPSEVVGQCEVVRRYGSRSTVRVAPGRLNLALMTIVTNAFEANAGKGQVHLDTEDDESSVMITIADQGPGISAERIQRLFEFLIDEDAQRVKASLGLPAAYSLIKKHGGDIAVRSREEGGTCFVITLPREA